MPSRPWSSAASPAWWLILVGFLGFLAPARGLDLSANGRAWWGSTDTNTASTTESDQRYGLNLTQNLSPWLNILGAYRYTTFRTALDLGPAFERTTSEPQFGLRYERPKFSARFLYQDRAIRTTDETQDLDIRSLLGNLEWRPSWGTVFRLRLQDATSVADPAVFGRDSALQSAAVDILQTGTTWTARYTYDVTKISNNATGAFLDQDRHEFRGTYADSYYRGLLSLALDGRYAQLTTTDEIPSGTPVTAPVPIQQGLSAVDTSPALGELGPNPSLIDGDRVTPAVPPIQIGGANTFRNIGVDLGITRPLTELEISISGPSGPTLVWEVYESPDNLNWFLVIGASSQFDAGFLNYTIRFPETTNRYFKAVNVSINAVNQVAVTEIRALVESDSVDVIEGDGNEYWLNLNTSLRPHKQIELLLRANLRADWDLTQGTALRDHESRNLATDLVWRPREDLRFRVGYETSEVIEDVEPVLERLLNRTTASMDWRPLPTVNVILSANRREENEQDQRLNESSNINLRAVTELFPDLRVVSEIGYSNTEDFAFEFTRGTWRWFEGIQTRPTQNWSVTAGFAYFKYDSTGIRSLTQRTTLRLGTIWSATRYLTFNGNWQYGNDDLGNTLTQRYGILWSPGPRLSTSLNYFDTASGGDRRTSNSSLNVNYRLTRHFTLWVTALQSTTGLNTGAPAETSTYRLGIKFII